jgi:hypothetical protein
MVPEVSVNLIDRLIAWLSPTRALRGLQARQELSATTRNAADRRRAERGRETWPNGFGQIRDDALRVFLFSLGVRPAPRGPAHSVDALDCSPPKRVHGCDVLVTEDSFR